MRGPNDGAVRATWGRGPGVVSGEVSKSDENKLPALIREKARRLFETNHEQLRET